MIAYVGKPFKLKFINNSNVDIELQGDIDVSKMVLQFNNHQPYMPPRYQHMGGSKVRIFYDTVIPQHTVFEFVFITLNRHSHGVTDIWNKVTPYFRTILKRAFFSVLIAALFGVAIYADNKYNEGKIGNWFTPSVWFAGKISESEESVKAIDTRILTNDHKVYESEGFKEAENVVNQKLDNKIEDLIDDEKTEAAEKLFEERVSLKGEYWFLGEELFVFRGIVENGGKAALVTFEVADDFCDSIGGRVISVDEYGVMNGLLVYLSSIFRVSDESDIPEWTRTETSDSDYNRILMKSSNLTPINSMNIGGEIAGDIEQTKAAFRCTMNAADFIEAQ
jgi:hypothetical protein